MDGNCKHRKLFMTDLVTASRTVHYLHKQFCEDHRLNVQQRQ